MKINEIVSEGKIRKAAELATPNLETWPQLDNNNSPYLAYRFGIALARSPAHTEDHHSEGPIGGQFTTIGYSEADNEILRAAAKVMGVKPVRQSSEGSKELPWVNTVSPIQPKGPVKRKSK